MRKHFIFLLPILFCVVLQGCLKDKITKTYTIMTPVYKEKAEVYGNIKSNAPQAVHSPGKLFVYGNYIFLNEIDKGVHVIDNTDPSHPVMKAFINIPGNLDIAVKGNTLYADLYKDMVIVDISDPLHANYVKHINNVFPERVYHNGFVGDSNRIIVDWSRKDTTVRVNMSVCNSCDALMIYSGSGGVSASNPIAVAGSMARFAIVNNYLYTVNKRELGSYNISTTNDPVRTAINQVGWNIETIYPFTNKLFIGSMNGMFIYDISNPATPVSQGQFIHARSCDPVIADGNRAYVTLRQGNTCDGLLNELHVLDISNMSSPSLLKTYQMTNPHGLAKDHDLLFTCDGKSGLKIYDATDPMNIVLKKQITGLDTYDAIALNGNLLVVANDGLYQYGYTAAGDISLRSKISVNH